MKAKVLFITKDGGFLMANTVGRPMVGDMVEIGGDNCVRRVRSVVINPSELLLDTSFPDLDPKIKSVEFDFLAVCEL